MSQVVTTPAALDLIQEGGQSLEHFLARHSDTEILGATTRCLSAHRTRTGRWVWVLTEADQSVTVILLPSECMAVLKPERRRVVNSICVL